MNALRYSLKQLLAAHRDRKFVIPNYHHVIDRGIVGGRTGRLKSKKGKKIKKSRNALPPPYLRSPNELGFQENYIFPGSED